MSEHPPSADSPTESRSGLYSLSPRRLRHVGRAAMLAVACIPMALALFIDGDPLPPAMPPLAPAVITTFPGNGVVECSRDNTDQENFTIPSDGNRSDTFPFIPNSDGQREALQARYNEGVFTLPNGQKAGMIGVFWSSLGTGHEWLDNFNISVQTEDGPDAHSFSTTANTRPETSVAEEFIFDASRNLDGSFNLAVQCRITEARVK